MTRLPHIAVLATAVALATPASPARADQPLELEGTVQRQDFEFTPPFAGTGRVQHFGLSATSVSSGDFTSSEPTVESYRCIAVQDGRTVCRGEQLFTGTVAGVGHGEARLHAVVVCDAAGVCTGRFQLEGVSGALTDLRATGTSTVDLGSGAGSYTVRVTKA